MPGLFGYANLDLDRPVDSDRLGSLFEGMKRRLSYSGGEIVDERNDPDLGVRLGRVRLPGHPQLEWPSQDHSPELGSDLFFDGHLHTGAAEASNLETLDRSSLDRALIDLGGFFSVAGYSRIHPRSFFVAVDRSASRPVFYSVLNRMLFFAPEAKALLGLDGLSKDLDHAAVGSFFSSGYLLDDQTLIASIRRLRGGCYLLVRDGVVNRSSYWRFRPDWRGDGTPEADLEIELASELRSAVGRNFTSPEQDAILLSGGIDSRVILGAAHDQVAGQGSRILAVTWSGGYQSHGSDILTTRALARDLDLIHLVYARTLRGYGDRVARMSFLLDGSTDIAAFHPSELEIMQQLNSVGIRRVLRGDQSFGVREGIVDRRGALAEWLRPFSSVPRLPKLFRSGPSGMIGDAHSYRLEGLLESHGPDIHPGDLSQVLYFENRLQTYLGPAGYFKQLVLDHRNPLLDERLLDLTLRMPIGCRIEKNLFRLVTERAFPRVFRVPLATNQVLEDFGRLLSSDSPVRRAVAIQLADLHSPVWNLLDRGAVQEWFDNLPRARGFAASGSARRRWVKQVKGIVGGWPWIGRQLRYSYRLRYLPPEDFFLRFLVFKLWLDLCVVGDGSQESLSQVQSTIRSNQRESSFGDSH